MSHRSDYLFALGIALGKDREVTRAATIAVIDKAFAYPEHGYVQFTADTFAPWYEWLLGRQEAPAWVKEVLENEQSLRDVVCVQTNFGDPLTEWWSNADKLYRGGELPQASNRLIMHGIDGRFCRVQMTKLEYEELIAWSQEIPGVEGYWPFGLFEGEDAKEGR